MSIRIILLLLILDACDEGMSIARSRAMLLEGKDHEFFCFSDRCP
jgi:hypothetical protein